MLTPENNYGFRRRLNQVHKPNRYDKSVQPAVDEVRLDDSWNIVIAADASKFLFRLAQDLQDYLAVSMGINVAYLDVCMLLLARPPSCLPHAKTCRPATPPS